MKGNKQKLPLAATALFTFLSPYTRHPMSYNFNMRQTNMDSISKCHGGDRSYKEALQRCDQEDSVTLGSTKQVYMLVTSIKPADNDSTELPEKGYNNDEFTHLRSMTHLSFGRPKNPAKSLLLSKHAVVKPTVDEINRLMFLLGISPFTTKRTQSSEDMSFVQAEHIIEHFVDIPLYDSGKLKRYITNHLGFDFEMTTEKRQFGSNGRFCLFSSSSARP